MGVTPGQITPVWYEKMYLNNKCYTQRVIWGIKEELNNFKSDQKAYLLTCMHYRTGDIRYQGVVNQF